MKEIRNVEDGGKGKKAKSGYKIEIGKFKRRKVKYRGDKDEMPRPLTIEYQYVGVGQRSTGLL